MELEYNDIIKEKLFAAPECLAQRFLEIDNKPQQFRNMFMRDRDRILYSKSFRRLSGKTQIYTTGKDDHQRNRLTHTLEVSQIATTIAQSLGLDRDLAEAIALGHDLGHTPFGHAGEQLLHLLMVPGENSQIKHSPFDTPNYNNPNDTQLGFKHNLQSIRMAISLENIYDDVGLNLTNYALWGIQRHSSTSYSNKKLQTKYLTPTFYDQYKKYYQVKNQVNVPAWSFEAFVVAEADEIAQLHHDLEDAIRGNAMTRTEIRKTIKSNLWDIMSAEDKSIYKKMQQKLLDDESFIVSLSRVVVNTLVNTIITNSLKNLDSLKKKYVLSKEKMPNFFFEANPELDEIKMAISYCEVNASSNIHKKLRKYSTDIATQVHNSITVQRMNTKGQYIIRKLFQAYYSNPQQLPNHSIIQFLISVDEYKSKKSATNALKQNGEGFIRTEFVKFWSSKKADPNDIKINLMRVICDHIASMTDGYALEEFKRLYN